jgi:hypothetical protein
MTNTCVTFSYLSRQPSFYSLHNLFILFILVEIVSLETLFNHPNGTNTLTGPSKGIFS